MPILDPTRARCKPIEPFAHKWSDAPPAAPLTTGSARRKAREQQRKYRAAHPHQPAKSGPPKPAFNAAETERQAAALQAWIAEGTKRPRAGWF